MVELGLLYRIVRGLLERKVNCILIEQNVITGRFLDRIGTKQNSKNTRKHTYTFQTTNTSQAHPYADGSWPSVYVNSWMNEWLGVIHVKCAKGPGNFHQASFCMFYWVLGISITACIISDPLGLQPIFLDWLPWFIKKSKQFNQNDIAIDIAALTLTVNGP